VLPACADHGVSRALRSTAHKRTEHHDRVRCLRRLALERRGRHTRLVLVPHLDITIGVLTLRVRGTSRRRRPRALPEHARGRERRAARERHGAARDGHGRLVDERRVRVRGAAVAVRARGGVLVLLVLARHERELGELELGRDRGLLGVLEAVEEVAEELDDCMRVSGRSETRGDGARTFPRAEDLAPRDEAPADAVPLEIVFGELRVELDVLALGESEPRDRLAEIFDRVEVLARPSVRPTRAYAATRAWRSELR
jgi:hypothetical protein